VGHYVDEETRGKKWGRGDRWNGRRAEKQKKALPDTTTRTEMKSEARTTHAHEQETPLGGRAGRPARSTATAAAGAAAKNPPPPPP